MKKKSVVAGAQLQYVHNVSVKFDKNRLKTLVLAAHSLIKSSYVKNKKKILIQSQNSVD